MKAGSQILVKGWAINGTAVTEPATVCRTNRAMMPIPAGYVPVRFADGARILVHESRVTRAGA